MDRVVIVGGGLAAAHAAETLRGEGHRGQIVIVAGEPLLPYERPQLSKDFLQGSDFKELHDRDWYAEHDIEVRNGTWAERIDTEARRVEVSDGDPLEYDALLLTTGATPRRLDLPGIDGAVTLRTLADAEQIRDAFGEGRRIVTIGGGWIGLEVAASARTAGCDVTVLNAATAPLVHVLGPELAEYVRRVHERHGVDLRSDVEVTGIDDGAVTVASGERFPADLIVLAVGATPDVGLAAALGLPVDDGDAGTGVLADTRLRTSDPAIWAAGDVALATHTRYGPLRVEHWDNAIRQGKLAGRSILDLDGSYDWEPYFYTDQFEFSMEYVGRSGPEDSVVIRGDLDESTFIAYWIAPDGHTVTAGMNVGIWDVNDTLREMIGTTVDPAQLTDLR
ncbi:NAD(P)/FAD-dependent oxidoreductase [Nocardioides sp. GXZ039]|uniref:NAD(P)/FAD-dependent oxidoreductase n=1 Tax=Nocardioides sp. GXZ039 TaxID=3136018 RepID=UPI0030F3A8CB